MIIFKWIGALCMGLGMVMIFSYLFLPVIGAIFAVFLVTGTLKDKGYTMLDLEMLGATVVAMIVQSFISFSLLNWLIK